MSVFLWVVLAPLAFVAVFVVALSALRRRRDNLITTTGRGGIGRVLAVGHDDDDLGGRSYWVKVQLAQPAGIVSISAARPASSSRSAGRTVVSSRT
jgi:hypothetical protein